MTHTTHRGDDVHPVEAAMRDDGWQPIETAPKDGTDILIGGDHGYSGGVLQAEWGITRLGHPAGWVDMEGDTYNPTHWMPLPAAPTEGA